MQYITRFPAPTNISQKFEISSVLPNAISVSAGVLAATLLPIVKAEVQSLSLIKQLVSLGAPSAAFVGVVYVLSANERK